ELVDQVPGLYPTDHIDHEGVEWGWVDDEDALGVTGEEQPLDADAEADARGGRAAQHLDQPVIATASPDAVLSCLEGGRREFERGPGVVVEAAHEAMVEDGGHSGRLETFSTA